MRGGEGMRGVTLEVVETISTDAQEDLEIRCECTERENGRITLTIPAFEKTPAVYITLNDNEFDEVAAVVDDFRKKRSAIASTYTKGD